MSNKVVGRPEIEVGLGSNTRLFAIVEFAQKKFSDQHFCASRCVVKDYHLTFEPCEYQGPLKEEDVRPNMQLNGAVLEHFLQSVRKYLLNNNPNPLLSFMDVKVQATDGWQDIHVVEPCKWVNQKSP